MFKLIESNRKEMKEVLNDRKTVWIERKKGTKIDLSLELDKGWYRLYRPKQELTSGKYELLVSGRSGDTIKASFQYKDRWGVTENLLTIQVDSGSSKSFDLNIPRGIVIYGIFVSVDNRSGFGDVSLFKKELNYENN